MKAISEKRNFNNKTITFIWHPAKRLDLPVWQVYVFCVTKDNKVVLVRDKGEDRFTLPGGRTRAGEKAEETAKRETEEETGYQVKDVRKIFEVYMSPGSVTEIVHFFVGEYTKDMKVNDGGGVADEQENIEVLEFPFHEAYDMITSGEIKDAKTIMLLQYAKINGILN